MDYRNNSRYNGQGNPVPTKTTDRETQSLRKQRTGKPRHYENNGQGNPGTTKYGQGNPGTTKYGQGNPITTKTTDKETQALRKQRTGKPNHYENNGQGNPITTKTTDRETQALQKQRTGKPRHYEYNGQGNPVPTNIGAVMRNLWKIRFMRYTLHFFCRSDLRSAT